VYANANQSSVKDYHNKRLPNTEHFHLVFRIFIVSNFFRIRFPTGSS